MGSSFVEINYFSCSKVFCSKIKCTIVYYSIFFIRDSILVSGINWLFIHADAAI